MNRRTGLVLLFTIAVLGGLIYFLNVNPDVANKPTPTTASGELTNTYLWTVDPTQITGIKIVDLVKGTTFNATSDANGVWTITDPKGAADEVTNQTLMVTYANTAASLTVSRTIDDLTNLADFGLDKPAYSMEVSQTNGTTVRATVGKKSVTGESYYVLQQGATKPVLVPTTGLDSLLSLPAAPPFATPTPAVTETPLPTLPLPAPTPTP